MDRHCKCGDVETPSQLQVHAAQRGFRLADYYRRGNMVPEEAKDQKSPSGPSGDSTMASPRIARHQKSLGPAATRVQLMLIQVLDASIRARTPDGSGLMLHHGRRRSRSGPYFRARVNPVHAPLTFTSILPNHTGRSKEATHPPLRRSCDPCRQSSESRVAHCFSSGRIPERDRLEVRLTEV